MSIAPMPGATPDVRFVNASGEPSPYTKAMAKHAIKASDPSLQPHMARRNVMAERNGAGYRVSSSIAPGVAPEAGATLSKGRLLSPTMNRSNTYSFQSGTSDFN